MAFGMSGGRCGLYDIKIRDALPQRIRFKIKITIMDLIIDIFILRMIQFSFLLMSASITAYGITCSSPFRSCDNIWCAWKLLSNFKWDKAAYLNHCLYYVTDSVTFSKCLPEAPCQTEAPKVPPPQRSPFSATPLLHRLGLSRGGPDPAQPPGCLASP